MINQFKNPKTYPSVETKTNDVILNQRRKIAPDDLPLNVDFKEAIIRFGLMLFLPMLMLFVDEHLIIYTIPVVVYLFVTGITHYCPVKRLWRKFIKHESQVKSRVYGKDMNYPDESV